MFNSMRSRILLICLLAITCLSGLVLHVEYVSLPTLSFSFLSGLYHNMTYKPRLIVVGSGLGGASAAFAAIEADPNLEVVILEKEAKPGGNSMKASSGINALSLDQGDSHEAFKKDTVKSGGGLSRPELVETLVVSGSSLGMVCEPWQPGVLQMLWTYFEFSS